MKLCIILSCLILLNSVSSETNSSQTTMINLSDLLHNQTSSITWDVKKNPCSWEGVKCNNLNITELSLSNHGLTDATFLWTVCQINSLEVLDVSQNRLSLIPDDFFTTCGNIQSLKTVNFSFNRVSGVLQSFGDGFTALQSLDMTGNLLTGEIGTQLSNLVSLKILNLSFNKFTGLIPVKIGKIMNLVQLQLSSNDFHGDIPAEITDCKNLTFLDLSSNSISGNLSSSFGNLLKLEILVLSNNSLIGEIPNSISKIKTLKRFAAHQNMFTGNIPAGITKYVTTLDLSYNSFDGLIPDDLLFNQDLETVDISYNKLVGNIPANVSSSLLFRLRAGGNSLTGNISDMDFSKLQNLQYIELEKNGLTGNIPSKLGLCQKLKLLNLAENSFSGNLPSELGNLKELTVLSLQFNNIGGEIPHEITQLTNLLTLNISWNGLTGSIPPSISGLSNLVYLHLQNNNLTGSIPRDINSLKKLIELQLGKNQLSGYLESVPSLVQFSLNLSHNLFEGRIPKSLDQLSSVEILDLSYNRFYGQIPDFLPSLGLGSLTLLLLNNNNLSGEVPYFPPTVLVDINGNPNLVTHSKGVIHHKKKLVASRIGVGIGALLFGGLIAFLAVFISRRFLCRGKEIEIQPNNDERQILTTNNIHKANIDFTKAMDATTNPLNMVSKTKFSSYYKVNMDSERNYLIKRINCSDSIILPSSHESFSKELEALSKLNSSNIMIPLAYMLTSDSAYLFYDLSFKGTLFDALHRNSGISLDWVSRCTIAVGLAQGLTFLHGCSSGPILLFDLTSKTVMLKSLKEPKIGDIELCKVIDPSKKSSSLSAVAGSVGYIPPEYAYTMRVTTAGNVYSFGVILLELVTGKQAVSEGAELAKWIWSNSTEPQKWDRILDYSVGRTSPAIKSQMLAVLKIALACINASPEARPKMKSVLRMLLNVR